MNSAVFSPHFIYEIIFFFALRENKKGKKMFNYSVLATALNTQVPVTCVVIQRDTIPVTSIFLLLSIY